eukprot:2910443-Amphidinium_carterae.1
MAAVRIAKEAIARHELVSVQAEVQESTGVKYKLTDVSLVNPIVKGKKTLSYTHLVEVQEMIKAKPDLGLVVGTPHASWPLPLGFNNDVPEIMGLD